MISSLQWYHHHSLIIIRLISSSYPESVTQVDPLLHPGSVSLNADRLFLYSGKRILVETSSTQRAASYNALYNVFQRITKKYAVSIQRREVLWDCKTAKRLSFYVQRTQYTCSCETDWRLIIICSAFKKSRDNGNAHCTAFTVLQYIAVLLTKMHCGCIRIQCIRKQGAIVGVCLATCLFILLLLHRCWWCWWCQCSVWWC